ncbi:MAG: transposase [Treponema sp.]|nr:transposase [Treponema sp.]
MMAGIQDSKAKAGGESLIVQTVKQAGKVVEMMGKPAILLLDAFFFSKTTLRTAACYVGRNGQGLLSVITRSKGIAVAYREPEHQERKRRGRRRIYGKKVTLKTLFEKNRKDFITTHLVLYGSKTRVQYLRVDLIHRPTRLPVRVVLTAIGTSRFILMSSSRALDGETIISLYAQRFKIEGLFGELKNRLEGFGYHFWTFSLERRKKGALPVLPRDKKMRYDIEMTKKSMEIFVFCHCLSYAILTGLALTGSEGIWGRFTGWLRNVQTSYPSLWVTKQVISEEFHRFLPK